MAGIGERIDALRAAGGSIEQVVFEAEGIQVVRRESLVERYVNRSRYGQGGRFTRPSLKWVVRENGRHVKTELRKAAAIRWAERMVARRTA